ncbi:hypothetical protein SprV_0501968900 [Sparganum proliferum]
MEAIVKKATMEFLEQGHLLSDLQHGFRQNRPCLSSLLLSTEQWTRALDEDGRVDIIYTDFKKAFDNVPHKRLIYILSEIGIRGRLLTWITDFLTGRSQTVCIEASTSTLTPDLSGVPQGSVLGPLLFLVYINDCVDDLGCGAILFADDVKLWRPIRSDADRQLRGDLIQTHRIVRSREFALDFDEFFELAEADRLRGHPFKLQRFDPSALQHFEDTRIMETVQFTEGMILTELQRLKESKSPGPDEIPAKILKELAGELAKPLAKLFHTSFETGYLPSDWKSAWITPLYKGGSRVSANNHRPVSLTSICCKIMEKITKQQVMQFLEQNHLLSNSQHGFCKSRSSVTNLLYCLEHWTRAADRGDMVHDIYVDFKKAFDSVPHHRLLYKLSRAGVRVNDCANELGCDVAMFADDIKIWSTIRSEVDEARLQTNLDHLEQWSKAWHLPFNVNKCNFLSVGGTSSPNRTVYRLTGKPLQIVDSQ